MLVSLATDIRVIRKAIAQAISAIALIELKNNKWQEIITSLTSNSRNTNMSIKLASIETLSYICEEIEEKDLMPNYFNIILESFVVSLNPNETEEVKLLGIKGVLHLLRFCLGNFKIPTEKAIIIKSINETLLSTIEETKAIAMQCFVEIGNLYYDFLEDSIQELFKTVCKILNEEKFQSVCLQALEFCFSIFDEEAFRVQTKNPSKPCKYFCQTYWQMLIPILLNNLNKIDEDDDSEWNISVGSSNCISSIIQLVGSSVAIPVLELVSKYSSSADWRCKLACLLAYSSVLDLGDKNYLEIVVKNFIEYLKKFAKDEKSKVRETSIWTLGRICSLVPNALFSADIFNSILELLLTSLEDKPRVSHYSCQGLMNLSQSVQPQDGQETSMISPYIDQVLSKLWFNAFRKDPYEENFNIIYTSFSAMNSIIGNSAPDSQKLFQGLIPKVLESIKTTLNSNPLDKKNEDYQSCLFTLLNPLLTKNEKKTDIIEVNQIAQIIISSFRQRGKVFDEGMLAISGLAMSSDKSFAEPLNQLWPYIIHSLKEASDNDLLKATLHAIGDISRTIETAFFKYLEEVMPILLEILKNPKIDRNIKLSAMIALGDIAISTQEHFNKYIEITMKICTAASELSLKELNSDEDPDFYKYIFNLRESLLDTLSSLVLGCTENESMNKLEPFLPFFVNYCKSLVSLNPSVELLKQMAGLIGDVAKIFRLKFKPYAQEKFIALIYEALKNQQNRDYKKAANYLESSLAKLIK